MAQDVVMEQALGTGVDRPNDLAIGVDNPVDPLGWHIDAQDSTNHHASSTSSDADSEYP
jgi:hypothetical protein